VRRQFAEERNEVAVAVPLDAQLKVWELPKAIVCEKSSGQDLVLYALQLLVMSQEKLNHSGIS